MNNVTSNLGDVMLIKNIYPKTSTAFLYYKFQLVLLSINGSGVKYFAVNLKV